MSVLRRAAGIVACAVTLAATGCASGTDSKGSAQSRAANEQPTAPSPAPAPSPAAADIEAGEILDEIALTRAGIQARRQAIVTSSMDLTAEESQAFWPVYRDYRTDMAKVDDRLVDLILVYTGHYDSLSDDMAAKLLSDYLDIERARLEVKNQYIPRFQRVLPTRKVVRFFQVDNKLDKKLQAELAAEIPLTR